jgi:hypothetical protein
MRKTKIIGRNDLSNLGKFLQFGGANFLMLEEANSA